MMKKMIYAVMAVLALASCKGGQTQQQGEATQQAAGLPMFDLQKEYPSKRIVLQNIADVEYIPMETHENALMLNANFLKIGKDRIVSPNVVTGEIIIFDRSGKHLHTFSRKGEGGKEYVALNNLTVDFERKEIFVFDYRPMQTCYIKVYSFEGEWLRSLDMSNNVHYHLYDYDKDYLFAEELMHVDMKRDEKINPIPYYLISKQTGEVKPLSLKPAQRIRNTLLYSTVVDAHSMTSITLNYAVYPILKNGPQVVISDFVLDTIYVYKDQKLIPVGTKTNRTTQFGSTIMSGVDVLTENMLVLRTQDKRVIDPKTYASPDRYQFLCNRQTGEIHQVEFVDANNTAEEEHPRMLGIGHTELPEGCALMTYNPEQLIEWHEAGKLKGELAKLASTLQFDDNPVLVLVKFKK